jgi:hypothetical protein
MAVLELAVVVLPTMKKSADEHLLLHFRSVT